MWTTGGSSVGPSFPTKNVEAESLSKLNNVLLYNVEYIITALILSLKNGLAKTGFENTIL